MARNGKLRWKAYDPGWLPEALAGCTRYGERSRAYYYFVDPSAPNQPGSDWQFGRSIVLCHDREGEIVLDILRDCRVGGIEFIERI